MMKPTTKNTGNFSGRRWGWTWRTLAAGTGIVLAGFMAWGQDTNQLGRTNRQAPIPSPASPGRLEEAGTAGVSNVVADSNLLAPTNRMLSTSDPVDTNRAGPTNPVLSFGSPLETNRAASTNAGAPANGPVETNPGPPPINPVQVPPPSAPVPTSSPNSLDYASFRVIVDRNIFDPNRSPRRPGGSREFRRPARAETFSLVGTMNYEKGPVAFFDGSSFQFRKALRLGDTIAGFKLEDISYSKVKLAAGSNQLELAVGAQMRREDEGDWFVTTRTEPTAGPSLALAAATSSTSTDTTTNATPETASSDTPPPTASSEPPAASGGSESDVLKKLMQRREQEMNK